MYYHSNTSKLNCYFKPLIILENRLRFSLDISRRGCPVFRCVLTNLYMRICPFLRWLVSPSKTRVLKIPKYGVREMVQKVWISIRSIKISTSIKMSLPRARACLFLRSYLCDQVQTSWIPARYQKYRNGHTTWNHHLNAQLFCLQKSDFGKIVWGIDWRCYKQPFSQKSMFSERAQNKTHENGCFPWGILNITSKLYISVFTDEKKPKNWCVLERPFPDLHSESSQGIVAQILQKL